MNLNEKDPKEGPKESSSSPYELEMDSEMERKYALEAPSSN